MALGIGMATPRVSTEQGIFAIAAGSVAVAFVVLGLKVVAWYLTGSVALLSDALESVVNVATALAALVAVRLAARPADAALPYGYYKAEYISAVVEGVLILLAAFVIMQQAYGAFFAPRTIEAPWLGIGVNLVASVLNGVWCYVLLREGHKRRSPALSADGRHLLSDVISSLGVAAGVAIASLSGLPILDPIIAVLVALGILWSGSTLLRDSVGGLMDAAVAPETMAEIKALIGANAEGAIEAHDIRTRRAGRVTFVDFHLVVPGAMPVETAHAICDRIEDAVRGALEDVYVTIHIEPENKAKHSGIVVL